MDGSGEIQAFAYERKGNSAVIRRCFSRDTKAAVPEVLDGLPVTELAPYAFSAHLDPQILEQELTSGKVQISRSMLVPEEDEALTSVQRYQRLQEAQIPALCGEQLEELELPERIVRVGRYCLYNCDHLRRLTFTGHLADWGTGVFTGCHHIREVELSTDASGMSTLKDMLDEVHEALHVRWCDASQQVAELMYPEFYEEGVENTPARILETHVHGSGMRYRNCFAGRKIDFTQYDRLFPYAVAQEPEGLLVRLVCGRLRFPYALGEQAREQYETYLRGNPELFAGYFTDHRDMDGIHWYCEGPGAGHETEVLQFLDVLTERAGRVGFAEALGYAMEYRHAHEKKPATKRRFEL
ncbi:MAG: leucine-rich repeat protein [Lachnospiraceae bacterium]|nr:leucine-rich repeat protein [Lachnospiraceae bacterium]